YNYPHDDHVGWLTGPGGSKRIAMFECKSGATNCVGINNGSGNHAAQVSWAFAGSVENGQDPTISTTTTRSQRSGIAGQVIYRYYGALIEGYYYDEFDNADLANVVKAYQDAIADELEVLNHSWHVV